MSVLGVSVFEGGALVVPQKSDMVIEQVVVAQISRKIRQNLFERSAWLLL